MKLRLFSVLFSAAAMFAACSDSTDSIGSSISDEIDGVNVETASYDVASRSILADSVLSNTSTGYLGMVRDPETGAYITGDFMAQFYSLENFSFPSKSSIVTRDANGNVVHGTVRADSCQIRLFYDKHYGDSTSTMKLTAYEMEKPMNEDRKYYSNFDPLKEGYVRSNGIHKDKVYSLTDFVVPQNERDTATYEPYITINLNDPYTDKDGKTYNNYGTYVMQKYYDDPSNYRNAWTFRNNVVPGFYFKHKSGLGNMAYIDASQLDVYYTIDTGDSIRSAVDVFWGTEEVLQQSNITNDKAALTRLAADESCTYLKTPAGIFTELTLPVENVLNGHSNDNIASARLTIPRINSNITSEYAFDIPQTLLIIPEDSLYSFFEKDNVYNNRTSYIASYSSSTNAYTFSNISGMINAMANNANRSANWNKVVLIPVELTTTTINSSNYDSSIYYYYGYTSGSSTRVTKVAHDMSLTSTKLVKGTSSNSPLKLEVIYSRFK